MRGFGPMDPIAEDRVRCALQPILGVLCPTLFLLALAASGIDHPGAIGAALSLLGAAIALTGLALWWRRHPPEGAHRATTLCIAILQLCLVGQLLAVPDPALATAQAVLAIGIAYFLIDLRWMLSVQAVGIVCWLAATGLSESTPQWQIARLVTLAGYASAVAFHLGRMFTLRQIERLTDKGRELDEEARRSSHALQNSEARLRNAQRIAHVGSYEWDLEADELHWSDEHYRIFGWEPGEARIDSAIFSETLHPDDRSALVDCVAASLRDGTPVELQYRIRRKDGEERVVFGRGETDHDESGKPVRHAGTSLDVTDRHRAEEALRESEGRLMAILTAMDAGRAIVVTREGVLQSVLGEVPSGTGRFGVSIEQVVGRSIHDFLPGEAGDEVFEEVQNVYATGRPAELEASIDLPNGTFHFDISLRALESSAGGIESVLAIVRDMTQRRADAVALRQAQKLESLGVLAGGVAHDFNNLLAGVLGNAEVALDKLEDESLVRPEIQDIVQAGTRAAELTQELFTYAGTAKVEAEPVDLAALVEETARLVRSTLVGGVALELDRTPEPVWVHADKTQIRQVLMNFITNAADSMKAEGGCVRVRTDSVHLDGRYLERCTIQNTQEPGEFCRVEVSDHGTGMDPRTLDKIFDPFYTTKPRGRGLGLASAAGIVRAHAGAIYVESEPGVGSSFVMLLPRTTLPTSTPAPPRAIAHAEGRTILIVDDEELVRGAARRALESKGHRVLEASGGAQAIAILSAESAVDLAIVDLSMPEMDGEQTFEALRALEPDLPIIFISGHSDDAVALRVGGRPRSSHITKPFRVDELGGAVAALLAERDAESTDA